jgi:hypothetical protein
VYFLYNMIVKLIKRVPRRPPVYKSADYDGEELEGTFYEQELQKVNKSDSDYYRTPRKNVCACINITEICIANVLSIVVKCSECCQKLKMEAT